MQEISPKERTVTVTIPTTTIVERPVERVVETTRLVTVTKTVLIPVEHVVQANRRENGREDIATDGSCASGDTSTSG